MKKNINLLDISKSRKMLFGISTLWIALFHSSITFVPIKNYESLRPIYYLLSAIRNVGDVGVEIFLFLSGVGLFFSFSKDEDIKKYYYKRFIRVIPESIFVSFIWNIIKFDSIKKILLSISFLDVFITGERIFWFISFIILMYLIYPFIYKLYKKYGFLGFICSIVFVISLNFVIKNISINLFEKIEILTLRIPIFLIGSFLAKYIKKGVVISYKLIFLFIAFFFVTFFLSNLGFIESFDIIIIRLLYIPMSLSIIILTSYSYQFFKTLGLVSFFEYFGDYSFEIYLLFDKINSLMYDFIPSFDPFYFTNTFVAFLITMIISFVLKRINSRLFYIN